MTCTVIYFFRDDEGGPDAAALMDVGEETRDEHENREFTFSARSTTWLKGSISNLSLIFQPSEQTL